MRQFTSASEISMKPTIPQAMQSRSVLLKNMFDPEEYAFLSSLRWWWLNYLGMQGNWTWLGHRPCRGCQRRMRRKIRKGRRDHSRKWNSGMLLFINEVYGCRWIYYRARFMSNSTPSSPPRMPSKVWTDVGLAENKFQLHSSPMRSCKPTSSGC